MKRAAVQRSPCESDDHSQAHSVITAAPKARNPISSSGRSMGPVSPQRAQLGELADKKAQGAAGPEQRLDDAVVGLTGARPGVEHHSIGIAGFAEHGSTAEQLLAAADAAMDAAPS